MNYISQLNRFYDSLSFNSLTPNSVCLYSVLLHINNKCNWKAEFTISNKSVTALTGLSRVQLDRARNELKQKGYIDYKKGTGNLAGTYLIVEFDTQIDTQVYTQEDTQVYTQTDTQVIHKCSTLNKHKQKLNKEIIIPPYNPPKEEEECAKSLIAVEEVVEEFNRICVSYPQARQSYTLMQNIARLSENGYTLEDIKKAFEKAQGSELLKGGFSNGGKATVLWLTEIANFEKTLNGNYDGSGKEKQAEERSAEETALLEEYAKQWRI
jgi:DNA-binding transcriptional MerR regulator